MSNMITSLTEDELSAVSGGANIAASFTDITVVLDAGESAADVLGTMSLPFNLKLDSESDTLLRTKIAPDMDTKGYRKLYATFSISLPYVHITNYVLS